MGDASGVGPELLVRAFAAGELRHPFVAFGDREAIELAAEKTGLAPDIRVISAPAEARGSALNLIDFAELGRADIRIGQISAAAGAAAVHYVQAAVHEALAGTLDGFCTLPINKEASRHTFAGFQGHTELIAEMCGVTHYVMMLAGPELACTHVSTHVSMREAVDLVRAPRILKVIELTHETLSRMHPRCRIAVAGLNPHAGENGAFGTEEADHIAPAIQEARALGIDARGPISPDTLFMTAFNGAYDAIVCMYHDQGHIPMKSRGFEDAVNVTLGLPIVRTSVDHGTAFDIAYQGIASTKNLVNAFEFAARLAAGRRSKPA